MDWTDIRLGNRRMKPEKVGWPLQDFPAITVEVVIVGKWREIVKCTCYVEDIVKHLANIRAGRNPGLH